MDQLDHVPLPPDPSSCPRNELGSVEDILRTQGLPERPARAGGLVHISAILRKLAGKVMTGADYKRQVDDEIARRIEE